MTSSKELRYCERCLSETVHIIVRKKTALSVKFIESLAERVKEGDVCELDGEYDTHSCYCICESCGKKTSY